MPIEILMPALSPTMTEGSLAKWIKKEGDTIKSGDVIAEIETDKATMEVEAADEGILGKILVAEGTENVPVNGLIGLILEEGEDKSALDSYQSECAKKSPETKTEAPKVEAPKIEEVKSQIQVTAPQANNSRIVASPLAKRIAADKNINLSNISGSGPRGRIIKDDVLNAKSSRSAGVINRNPEEFSLSKNSNIRKVIARRLLESKQTVPHFYLSSDLNINKLMEVRKALNDLAELDAAGKPEYKISVNDLVIKAVALGLKAVPAANSSWTDESILLYNNVDVSVAVAVDGGLITPIIRNADQKSLQEISAEMKILAKKAKDGKLQPEEFQGGGFSISNLGMYGIDSFQAIVNPPQSCILAVGAGVAKPIVVGGDIDIATIMNVTLSSDHRSVDGAVGAEFINALKKFIENPIAMLVS
ncbi:MAG: pyruvate dehydrogenase E2 component (dihydrolipoamide acetyltransferase) [Rickettsiales bacterium]|jgi:pyruvate dehydrogenase E2 component (dihydrolipoamide acetyltransferase)